MNTHQLNEKFDSLPYYLKREVLDYIEFLSKRQKIRRKKEPFSFRWEGGLKDIKEHFNSVDLQHKVRDYR
jgi:hypothetical protein